mgnify:CR=1 FL=1
MLHCCMKSALASLPQAVLPDMYPGMDDHAIADRPVVHANSECYDLAREIDAHNARHRHLYPGHTAPLMLAGDDAERSDEEERRT